jgi:hypothetical protein
LNEQLISAGCLTRYYPQYSQRRETIGIVQPPDDNNAMQALEWLYLRLPDHVPEQGPDGN